MFKIFSSAAFCITALPMSAALQIRGPGSSKEKQARRQMEAEHRQAEREGKTWQEICPGLAEMQRQAKDPNSEVSRQIREYKYRKDKAFNDAWDSF